MRTVPVLRGALAAALLATAGCSLTIDPESVEPPKEKKAITPRGACVDATGGHKLCGGQISAGSLREIAATHKVLRGTVAASASEPDLNVGVAGQHKIVRGDVSP